MAGRVFCLGSLNVDATFVVPRMPEEHEKLRCRDVHLEPGGSAANTAWWLARLGDRACMLGAVGNDPLGDWCVRELAGSGVDASGVQRVDSASTGMAAIFVNPSSKRMVTSGGANACFDPARLVPGWIDERDHLHVATPLASASVPLLRDARRVGASTSCDLDQAPGAQLAGLVDTCFMNATALGRECGAVSLRDAWRSEAMAGATALVVTRGREGAGVVTRDAEWFVPADPVAVVDRTGGGDAFDAGVLSARRAGRSWLLAIESGLRLARHVVAATGARPSPPRGETGGGAR